MADPPPFDPNKPYTTGSSGPPKFDPSKPYTTGQPTPEQPDVLGTQRGGRSLDIMPVVRGARDFVEAIPQGVLGIPEAIYQYAEHFGAPRPTGAIPDWLRNYQKQSESTWPGFAGETVGNIGGFVAGGALADALGLASRVPAVATRAWNMLSPAARTEISTIFQSQVAQPTQGDDFWTQKGESAFLAHLLGKVFGRASQQAQHDVATTTNRGLAEADRRDTEAVEAANRAAATAHTQTVKTEAEQHKALSQAQEEFHQQQRERQVQAAQTEAEQHRALAEAQERFHQQQREPIVQAGQTETEQHQALSAAQQQFQQQQREAAQRAANALSERTEAALEARRGQVEAARQVPTATTQGWWDRTLAQIGVKDPSIRTGPATGAKVRDIVGGRRNEIIGRMQLNSGDEAFTTRLNAIRDETMRDLPKSAKNKFYKPPREQDLASPIIDPTTGKPFPRATPATIGKPGTATGDWVKTVTEPLAKGNLSGRQLSDYISRLGARAEELARNAARVPQDERAEMYAMSNAYRQVADAVVGHAAGSAEDKLALETANRAYTMWSVANDAARAERGGVASPDQLIASMKRKLGGEARYEQALNNPQNPYHDTVNWLQAQRDAHRVQVPSEADVRRAQGRPPPIPPRTPTPITPPAARQIPPPRPTPIPPPAERRIPPAKPTPIPPPTPRHAASPRQPPPPRPQVPVPAEPRRAGRNIPRAAGEAGLAALLATHGHPVGAFLTGRDALRSLLRRPQPEGRAEEWMRNQMTRHPGAARPIGATLGTAAGQAPRAVPPKVRKAIEKAGSTLPNMFYKWVGQ